MNDEARNESEAEFLRRVEACFRRLRARPLLLSPADFRRAQEWHARGIPRWIVERTLEELFERARQAGRSPPRSLAYCASAVEEAFKAWRAIQIPRAASAGAGEQGEDPRALLLRAAGRVGVSRAPDPARARAQARLEAVARGEAHEEGAGPDVLMQTQRTLLRACWDALAPLEQAEIDARVEAQVAPFRDRMDPPLLERALGRAREQELLRRFDLPDLSLLPLLGA